MEHKPKTDVIVFKMWNKWKKCLLVKQIQYNYNMYLYDYQTSKRQKLQQQNYLQFFKAILKVTQNYHKD